jgi:hypothetical protein
VVAPSLFPSSRHKLLDSDAGQPRSRGHSEERRAVGRVAADAAEAKAAFARRDWEPPLADLFGVCER